MKGGTNAIPGPRVIENVTAAQLMALPNDCIWILRKFAGTGSYDYNTFLVGVGPIPPSGSGRAMVAGILQSSVVKDSSNGIYIDKNNRIDGLNRYPVDINGYGYTLFIVSGGGSLTS